MRLTPKPPAHAGPASLVLATALAMAAALAADGPLSYRTHWLGHAGTEATVPESARGLAVAADGTCVVSSGPECRLPAVALYRNGQLVGRAAPLPVGTHAFTGAVAVSDKHIFAAVTLRSAPVSSPPAEAKDATAGPPPGRSWHGLWRFTRDGRHAPAPNGRGAESAFLLVHETQAAPETTAAIAGVWIHEDTVFVSDAAAGRIRTFDEATLEPRRPGFPADQPSGLCVLAGNLQVIERGAVVSAFTLDGKRTGQVLDEGDDLRPATIAPTPEGRLMVADRGVSQQVHFFNMSGVPTRVRTLGEDTGVYGPPAPGEAGPRRFTGLTGVGADASGELFVAMSPPTGGLVLRQFAPDRKNLRWQLAAPALAHGADADPRSDGLDIYSSEGRHALDLGKPPGQSWRWVALTANPFRYPQDLRLAAAGDGVSPILEASRPPEATESSGPAPGASGKSAAFPQSGTTTFREIDGHKLLAVRSPEGSWLSLYRFQGQTAVPALVIHTGESTKSIRVALPGRPQVGPWIWRDANGDGQADPAEFSAAPNFARGRFQPTPLDPRGGIWVVTASENPSPAHRLSHWSCQGIDDLGIPLYHSEPVRSARVPVAAPDSASRPAVEALYDPARDSLYLVAAVKSESPPGGLCVTATDGWSQHRDSESFPGPPRWTIPLPASFQNAPTPSLATAGPLLFVLHPATRDVLVLETATGVTLGHIASPASVEPAPVDRPTAPALRAHRRRDGSYIVLTQDMSTPRVLVYHLDDPQKPLPGK